MEANRLRTIAAAVKIDRVMDRLGLLAKQAASSSGGVTRLAFSPQEREAMDLVVNWMEQAGLTVSYDALGNMFGTNDGNAPDGRPVMAGSHLDTVPGGGAYDGTLGVVGAIEAVEVMKAADFRPSSPVEIVVWRCEEAARFGQGRIGSLYHTGELTMENLRRLETAEVHLDSYLREAAGLPQRAPQRKASGYLELHIEQGRRLEAAATPIGVVTAIPGATRWRITVTGRADHSGATPMGLRRDALAAAAEVILAAERVGMEERSHEIVATAVNTQCRPGAWNVVPGWAEVWTDIRGIEQKSIDRALDTLRQITAIVARQRGVEIEIQEVTRGKPVQLNEAVLHQVEEAARGLNLRTSRLPSGAGHDAQTVAPYVPTGMIFIPSIGGISHAPEERSHPQDILAGVQVLAGTWAALASVE